MFELLPDLAFQLKALAALVALVLAGSAVRAKLKSRGRLPLPPGPPGHWLFGNALPKAKYVQLVSVSSQSNLRQSQSQQFAAWINQYGPVISLRLGPKTMIIIGRHQVRVNLGGNMFERKHNDRNQLTSWRKRVDCWQTVLARLRRVKSCHVDYV